MVKCRDVEFGIVNNVNEWHHNVEQDAVEGTVDYVSRGGGTRV